MAVSMETLVECVTQIHSHENDPHVDIALKKVVLSTLVDRRFTFFRLSFQ